MSVCQEYLLVINVDSVGFVYRLVKVVLTCSILNMRKTFLDNDVAFQDEWNKNLIEDKKEPVKVDLKPDNITANILPQQKPRSKPRQSTPSQAWSSSQREFFPAGMKSDELMDAVQEFSYNQMMRLDVTKTPAKQASSTPAMQASSIPAKQASSTPAMQASSTPAMQASSTPAMQASSTPAMQASSTPAKQASSTPAMQASSTPAKQVSTTPAKQAPDISTMPTGKLNQPKFTPLSRSANPANSVSKPPFGAPSATRPFIHGRHSCDSCKTSPIVGNRYHATNRNDFDICAKCFSKAQFTGIYFSQIQDGTYQKNCFVTASAPLKAW